MNITVRRATPTDLDWLIGQLKEFSRFFGTKKQLLGDDDAYAREALIGMMTQHVVLIAGRDMGEGVSENIGLIAGLLTPHPFNPNITMLSETIWWVSPEHQGSRAGLLLLDEFLKIGQQSAHWVTMSRLENSPINEKILLKRGLKAHEHSYLLEVG